MQCILCNGIGGELIVTNDLYRIVLVDDANYPGYVRLISQKHVKEMTDLTNNDIASMFQALLQLEKIIRKIYNPDKINLASLGNIVPHLHWHIIPRYLLDKNFPNPIWGDITHSEYMPSAKIVALKEELTSLIKQELR